MSQVRSTRSHAPLLTAEDALDGLPQHEDDGWSDTFLIAGLVVVLSVLTFLLIG